MKILIHDWSNYMVRSVRNVCDANRITYESFFWKFTQDEYDEEFSHWFNTTIQKSIDQYSFVISINYWPDLAKVCFENRIKYVAWCCDCPLNISNPEETMWFDTNFIFLFDRKQYEEYKHLGIKTVYHLPLGADAYLCGRFIFDEKKAEKYNSEISFVGSLYESQLGMIASALNDETKKCLNDIIIAQEEQFRVNIIEKCVTDNLIDYINSQWNSMGDNKLVVSNKALKFALSSETTRRNRILLLNLFSTRFDTRLYSFNSFSVLKNVKQMGTVDYYEEMPFVFRYSKINLNPCLRCIDTGIPLRAFDIMGYGGFLLSSFQEELDELYIDGQDMVMFSSYYEALDKAEYYLKNESVRMKIVENGMKKTLERHTLQNRFEQILRTIL